MRVWGKGRKKAAAPEHKLQVALVDLLPAVLRPEIVYRAIPNGELRHIRVAARLKAEGVRPGTPDLFFCLPEGRVAWLELKSERGSLSEDQKIFRDRVLALGHLWGMARSIDEAIALLDSWGALRKGIA